MDFASIDFWKKELCLKDIKKIKFNDILDAKEKIENQSEYLALFKTTKQKLQSLKKELEKLHPYDVPEIVEINPKSMNKPYLKWLTDSTV